MDRRLIGVLAVAATLLLAGCAGVAGDATPTDDGEPDRTIEVTADGEATAEPDRATITVAVEAQGNSSAAVREEIAADGQSLRSALREWGIEDDQIRTTRYDIRERRPRPEAEREGAEPEYVGVHRYEIEVHDVAAVGEVIDVAVDSGADSVNRVRFGLSEEREAELRTTAFENAVENADGRARMLADNTGLEVVNVYTISTMDDHVSPYRAEPMAVTEDAGGGGAATSIETGDVSVDVQVHVVFEAETTG
ncbi:SIMPL domain-containing protein [Halopenitus persicus]|uniref:SIMPL domain-containing protein n=1 Tax=Halopenitus persicus TaxID=1048396 RepID=UPI000BBB29B7|nr:SIMPL domain-containing protein [Halopenitus persicus]